ncbi:hypothetical protein UFOVP1124_11 [uncultured Caudovirales phage]|uniref:Uncharacterized protein n=1 Tax=uncultured Caudovirales phage TaxID=2100421 RepID=A0A6J5QUG1_9CAUD|nr:hypothetical protein UFOVP1124_11 [uncultured Caudovirales phage]
MAVIWTHYKPDQASGSGKWRESHVLEETWEVRVDIPPPGTTVMQILTAPGVAYGAAHPSFTSLKAMEWSYAAADSVGMLWHVTIKYYVPIVEVNPSNGLPLDVWSAKGTNQMYPFFKDKDGAVLTNSAGDPLEGMEREICFLGWSLTRSYASLADVWSQTKLVNNRTNSDVWPTTPSYGAADTWKASVSSVSKKVMVTQSGAVQAAARYWEVAYEIDYKEDTWHCKPWDMGFNQRVGSGGTPSGSGTGRATILGYDGKPARQPVALSGGVALPPGSTPVALDFNPYSAVSFVSYFGEPF